MSGSFYDWAKALADAADVRRQMQKPVGVTRRTQPQPMVDTSSLHEEFATAFC